jgi:outer membrane protein
MIRIFFLFLFLFSFRFFSQWSLESLIRIAEENNLNLKLSSSNVKLSRLNVMQTRANFFPTLNVGASHSYNFGKTIDRFTNTFANRMVLSQNFFIATNWVVFNGFSRYHLMKSSYYSYLAEDAARRNALYELRINVATAFLNVLLAEENMKISQHQLELSEYQLKRSESLLEAGVISKAAYADIKAQTENDRWNVVNAENNLRLQRLTLRQLCRLDTVKNEMVLVVPDWEAEMKDIEKFKNVSSEEIFSRIVKNFPSVLSAEYALKAAEFNYKSSLGNKFPTLSVGASAGTGYSGLSNEITGVTFSGYDTAGITSGGQLVFIPRLDYQTRVKPFFDQYKDNVNKNIGVTLSIPLLNNLQAHTNAARSRIQMENARINAEIARQNLRQNIENNILQFHSAYKRYQSSLSNEEAAELSFRFNEERWQTGSSNLQEYLQAKNRYLQAKIQKTQAMYELLFRKKILEILMAQL